MWKCITLWNKVSPRSVDIILVTHEYHRKTICNTYNNIAVYETQHNITVEAVFNSSMHFDKDLLHHYKQMGFKYREQANGTKS